MFIRLLAIIFALIVFDSAYSYDLVKLKKEYQRPGSIPNPEDNSYSKAKYDLGWKLFFDPRLSRSNFISCATCHNPGFAWGDGMTTGTGHDMKKLTRRTPTILNLAWGGPYMWDGRAETLEEQALGPIQANAEMNLPMPKLLNKLKDIEGYSPLFAKAFGDEKITPKRIAKAIAVFERTIVSGEAPFDRWIKGNEKAISSSAKKGFALFNGKAKCAECHSGWRFTDDGFHDIGVKSNDIGRAKIIPGIDVLKHAFKTPTLRNIAQRAPYMHNGSEKNLATVVELYNSGGHMKRPNLSPSIKKLNLTKLEKQQLLEFLKTLTSDDKPIAVPVLPL